MDKIITSLDLDALEEILLGFLAQLRNRARHDNVDMSPVWTAVTSFVFGLIERAGLEEGSLATQMRARLSRLESLYSQVRPNPERVSAPLRALPASVVTELYEIFNPVSPRNPFRMQEHRWRNLLLFLILLRLGLRRGEAGLLRHDASFGEEFDPEIGGNVHWLNVDESDDNDPRYEAASLKTLHSRRQVPLPSELVDLKQRVASNRGRTNYPFLFMSQKGGPLSLRSISDIFEIASAALSDGAKETLKRQGLTGVSPHDCRHTSVVVRLRRWQDQGVPLDDALIKARNFFGWKHDSNMPTLYGRAYFEPSLSEVWNEQFDDYLDALKRTAPERVR
ncbi:tyrosine-type recombinase/integrase [Neorhizobium galegae]|uniref:tyrosine-type recombinase/integrase n=1 Tax=Neorhizobium galegae TaxID=399 RepID=UPI0017826699|nr:tyrosine-type recombinase/integrase [Neorhizobium galegae]